MPIDKKPELRVSRLQLIFSLLVIAVCAALSGCASEVPRTLTSFVPAGAERGAKVVLTESISVTPSTGYSRTLKAGSSWRHVGDVPEGAVFKIENDVFMVEGKHMHEAYCVLNRDYDLVGFYLPVENGFVAITPAVPLPITKRKS